MTEAEWMLATEATPMLEHFGVQFSDRKLRLFACACCRRVWDLLEDESCRTAVLVAERFADGLAELTELETAHEEVEDFHAHEPIGDPTLLVCGLGHAGMGYHGDSVNMVTTAQICCQTAVGYVRRWDLDDATLESGASEERWTEVEKLEESSYSTLLREIFGNPFRPVSPNPEWGTSTVVSLARSMYESRDFSPMPLLADALQDAGCENEEILNHCRSGGPHVRGCWVVDLVLGKE